MSEDIKLVITLKGNGSITISGPIQDKVLSYGMLGVARDIVSTYQENEGKIAKPVFIPPKGALGVN